MKKYIIAAVGVLSLTFSFANAQDGRSECGCYDAPVGNGDYVTKEYVDSKFQPLFQKLDNINSRVEALSKQLSGLKGGDVSALSSKISQLKSALNDVKNSCPAECNSKLVEVEKNIAELKEKVEKRTHHMEKEVEKSMRK